MSYETASSLIVSSVTSFAWSVTGILLLILSVSIGILVFNWGWKLIQDLAAGRTNSISRGFYFINKDFGSKFDQLTYKPYKGYNRLHSRKWNMEHTM